jgi:hypothetical protein
VQELAALYGAELTEREAGIRVQGRRVSWVGQIKKSPASTLQERPSKWSKFRNPLPDGKIFVAGHL